jgi:hypothetical protein
MSEQSGNTLLGLPDYLDDAEAKGMISALRQTWSAMQGTAPGKLEEDLEACRRWFDPVAQGQRLRRELSQLPDVPDELADPGPPLTLSVGPGKRLVTPEGRCALDLLEHLPHGRKSHVISDAQLVSYDRRLALLYRDWSRHRLQSVVDLLAGTTKPLQIPAAGVVIALLVNRDTSKERALTRFAAGAPRDVVDQAFFAPVQAFADILAPTRRGNRSNPKLVSGWMLYEARRRLADALVVVDARGGVDGKVWIKPGSEQQVIDVVARDLVRGHRAHATPERFARAFDALVASLRAQLPSLAGFGLVHERPLETQRLRQRFLESLSRNLGHTP